MRRWLLLVLTGLAGRIYAVSDGWGARSVLMEEKVDIVISDGLMPMQSGIEAMTETRAAGIRVPLLLITASGGDDVRRAAAGLGAEVLAKPFAAIDLVHRVRLMCGLPEW